MDYTQQQFMKEVVKRFDDLDNRLDYLYRDFEINVQMMEKHNEALEELLLTIKGFKNV